jgi:predicted SAM-dependent methyltransferase
MIKLHLGCGWRNFGPDWVHIDGGDYEHLDAESITDLSQYNDASVDLIYSSHVVEYFDRDEFASVLLEWKRVLKPEGRLRIAVPNFEVLSSLYNKGKIGLDKVLGPLYGKMIMSNKTIYHRTVYDFKSLKKMLTKAGFRDIVIYNWHETEHSNFDDHSQAYIPHMDKDNGVLISLNVECRK